MAAIPGAFHTQALVTDVTPEPVCPCDAACPTRWSEDSRRVWRHRPSPPGSSVLCLESRLIVAWRKHSHTLLPAPLFSTKRVLRVVHTPRFRPEATAGPQPRAGGSSRRHGLQSGRQQTSSQHSYTPNACLKSSLSEHPAGLVTRGSVGLWPGPRAWAHALPASLCPWVLEGCVSAPCASAGGSVQARIPDADTEARAARSPRLPGAIARPVRACWGRCGCSGGLTCGHPRLRAAALTHP